MELGPGRASFLRAGSGRTVVLVHGLGLSADVWRPHLDALAERGYQAIAPDLPGYGRSESAWTGRSVPQLAGFLERFHAALDLEPAAWVGHSLSVQPLLRLAVTRPELVSALVLAAPTGQPGRHMPKQFLGLLRTAPREKLGLVGMVLRQYLGAPATTLGTWYRSQSHDALVDAREVAAPAVVVLGGRDPVVPPAFGRQLAETLPRGRLERIEPAAHAVALEPFQPFMDVLTRLLAMS